MRLIKNSKSQNGIGLIEVIIALGIAIIVITALVSLAVVTLRASLTNNLLLQGSKRASEELELVRAYRDQTDWATFRNSVSGCVGSSTCYISSSWTVSSGEETFGGGPTRIDRYFVVSDPVDGTINGNENLLRISVSVRWMVGSNQKYAHIYTDLSNWRGN